MTLVTLSLGSNINPAPNIRKAVRSLRSQFGDIWLSPVYESEAVGFDGDNFLNLVAAIDVQVSLEELSEALKALEDRQGRDRSSGRFSRRTLDIDILTFGELVGQHAGMELPRPEIDEHAFVLQPLADLLPEGLHPVSGKSFAQLWAEFRHNRRSEQKLWQVSFDWH